MVGPSVVSGPLAGLPRLRRVTTTARTTLLLASLLALVAGLLLPAPAAGQTSPDTILVGQGSTIDVTVELSQATFPEGGAGRVMIGRDDVFADSLASGVGQSDGPLLLVPTDGPVPTSVMEEIERLGAEEAVILGGDAAVSPAVADDLGQQGLTVQRVSGPSRIETAVEVARTLAPDADTAILARAGGINPTSGFADTLAAGGWAAETGWPVLLTQTEVLTGSTRDYLAGSGITTVNIVGGTAAISEAVAQSLRDMDIAVERVSGSDRAATAIAIAGARGSDSASDIDRVIVVDGFSDDAWAAGFGAAAMSAGGAATEAGGREDTPAPVVLGNTDDLPPATGDFLEEGPAAITCAVTASVCEQARLEVGFPPALQVPIPPGSVTFTVADEESSLLWTAQHDGSGAGLGFACDDPHCTIIDWHAAGERAVLAVQRPGTDDDAVYQLQGETLETVGNIGIREYGDDTFGMDAADHLTEASPSYVTHNDAFLLQDQIGGAQQSGAGPGNTIQPSFQGRNFHPTMANSAGFEARSGTLYLDGSQQLHINAPGSSPDREVAPQVQRRPGAQVIGAAWDPTQTGDIAITDQIAGVGVLRIAAWPDGTVVEVADLDVNSVPYWLPDGQTVLVMADTDGGVSLVAVDAASGAAEVLVDDAGDAADSRISADGSGTLIAWQAGNEIRVLNTADGAVAAILPPDGYAVVGGPAIRP